MKVSVIILNWNGAEMLRKYLPSVVRSLRSLQDRFAARPASPEGLCELIVADNGSTDESQAVVSEFQDVRWVAFDQNYGFAEGYNRIINQVDSEYVVLLNSDVEVTEHWLEPLITYLDEHPDVAAVQPKILSWLSKEKGDQPVLFEYAGACGGYMDQLGYPYCRGRLLSTVEADAGQYDTNTGIFWASGACLCVRTNIYKELGGLDAGFFAHQEEIDLCWRMNSRGYKLACVPSSVVYHLGGGALNYEHPRKTFLNFRNNLLMLYKNLPCSRLIPTLLIRFPMDYAAAFHFLITGKGANAWAVVKARIDFLKKIRLYRPVRQENLRLATVKQIPTICKRSLIIGYYLLGQHLFKDFHTAHE